MASKRDGGAARSQLLPIRSVDLDAAVFEWLQSIIWAKQRTLSDGIKATVPGYEDLLKRAAMAFKAAAGDDETPEAKPVRRIKRREPEPAVEPLPRGRIKRRPS